MVRRSAFTLMELIVTIVLLGLIFSSVPMLLLQNQNAANETLTQEALFASVAKLSQILTYRWDEASLIDDSNIANVYAKILDTQGDPLLNRLPNQRYRIGHTPGQSRRSFYPDLVNATPLINLGVVDVTGGINEAAEDDIDDHIQAGQVLIASDSAGGYKQTYTMQTTVDYVTDTAGYNLNTINGFVFNESASALLPTNIKRITIRVLLNNVQQFQLSSFVSNIGETAIVSKVFE